MPRENIAMWDAVIIGSGASGLCAAAALARCGRRVLMLEQHAVAGGMTQTFQRGGWRFATGVHYIGGAGPGKGEESQFRRVLDWLSGGTIEFADCGNPYDIVRLPGFEFGIEHPESRYRDALLERFPVQRAAIDRWFEEMQSARRSAMTMFTMRGTPAWIAAAVRRWRGQEVAHWSRRTVAEALADISDSRLRAVLGARWADYGAPPATAPLVEHALVTGAYNAGSFYPIGGPSRFAETLVPVVREAGGECLLGADVDGIECEDDCVVAVTYHRHGERSRVETRHVVSTMGAVNTVACLAPGIAPQWQARVRELRPGLAYVALYLGFEGDIARAGASAAQAWIYESDDVGRLWTGLPDTDAPGLFVSFSSMKDPRQPGGPTAEVLAMCDAQAFGAWMDLPPDDAGRAGYRDFKARLEERLLAQFGRHFPGLAPLVRFHELATPVTHRHYARTPSGAMYGLEMDPQRLASPALDIRTPVHGLLLAGQDVFGAGVPAAAMSGLLAATALEPRLLMRLGG
jgi:all-trans-retinol 13,14-reductase